MTSHSVDMDPPAYTVSAPPCRQQPAVPEHQPPSYEEANESSSRDQLTVTGGLLTLILDDCAIYAIDQPDKPLYELNRSPLSGIRGVYSIKKIFYQLSTTDGEGRIRSRPRRTYDFYNGPVRGVFVVGRAGPQMTFKEAEMLSIGTRWNGCSVEGHFSADRGMKQRLKGGNDIRWKDTKGKLVAVEYRQTEDGGRPRLEMKAQIEEKEFDLLVTCWMGRIFRASAKDMEAVRSLSTMEKLKRSTSPTDPYSNTARGDFAMAMGSSASG